MPRKRNSRWSGRLFKQALEGGLERAYRQVRVDPHKFMAQIRQAHRLPISRWEDMFRYGSDELQPHAQSIIRASCKAAALEGAGLGFGGFATLVPDMGILSAITIRLLQKLSLLYGFEYSSDEETVDLWIAAASAAGLDLGRDFLEKQAVEKLVPRLIDAIAVRVSDATTGCGLTGEGRAAAAVIEPWSGIAMSNRGLVTYVVNLKLDARAF